MKTYTIMIFNAFYKSWTASTKVLGIKRARAAVKAQLAEYPDSKAYFVATK